MIVFAEVWNAYQQFRNKEYKETFDSYVSANLQALISGNFCGDGLESTGPDDLMEMMQGMMQAE